jgi:hypothetical protein
MLTEPRNWPVKDLTVSILASLINKKSSYRSAWWHKTVFIDTWEAVIGRMVLRIQLRQKFCKTPLSIDGLTFWYAPVIAAMWGRSNNEDHRPHQPKYKARTYLKNNQGRKDWRGKW